MSRYIPFSAFENSKEIKSAVIEHVKNNWKRDESLKGFLLSKFLPCEPEDYNPLWFRYDRAVGIPSALLYLIERRADAAGRTDNPDLRNMAAIKFLDAIAPGTDLSNVMDKLMLWALELTSLCASNEDSTLLNATIKLYQRKIAGDIPTNNEWEILNEKIYEDRPDDYQVYKTCNYATFMNDGDHEPVYIRAIYASISAVTGVISEKAEAIATKGKGNMTIELKSLNYCTEGAASAALVAMLDNKLLQLLKNPNESY
jgi:hypothetical protein